MLDMITEERTSTADRVETEFTDEKAKKYLADLGATPRPSVRDLAAEWGWSKSKVSRFVARESDGTDAVSHECPTQAEKLAVLLGGAVGQTVERVIASPGPPKEEEFDWTPNNLDLIAPPQCAIAVYENIRGQVCIRAERNYYEDEDQFIAVSVENIPRLIERLKAVADGIREPGNGR